MNEDYGILFSRSGLLSGFARAFDLGNTMTEYNSSLTPEQADTLALLSDWSAVGLDITNAGKQLMPKRKIRLKLAHTAK